MKKLTSDQIRCLVSQVKMVILFGIASHDDSKDRSNTSDQDIADEIADLLQKRLAEYSF